MVFSCSAISENYELFFFSSHLFHVKTANPVVLPPCLLCQTGVHNYVVFRVMSVIVYQQPEHSPMLTQHKSGGKKYVIIQKDLYIYLGEVNLRMQWGKKHSSLYLHLHVLNNSSVFFAVSVLFRYRENNSTRKDEYALL